MSLSTKIQMREKCIIELQLWPRNSPVSTLPAAIAVFTGTWLECRSPPRGRGTRCRRCGWSSPGWGWLAPASTPASSPSPTRRGPASCPPSTSCWGNIYTRASNEPSRKLKFYNYREGYANQQTNLPVPSFLWPLCWCPNFSASYRGLPPI